MAWVVAAAILATALAAVAIAVVRDGPWLGADFQAAPDGRGVMIASVDPAGPSRSLQTPVTIEALRAADGGRVTLEPSDLSEDPDFIKGYPALDRFYARQSRIAALLTSGPVELELLSADGQRTTARVTPQRRPLRALPAAFLVQIFVGAVAVVVGAWVWALRPRDAGPKLFALTGLGLLVVVAGLAPYTVREIALPGALFKGLLALSMTGTWLLGASIIGLFLVYPIRLVGRRGLSILFGVCALALAIRLLRLAPTPFLGHDLPALGALLGLITALVLQAWASRRDPKARAVTRWFGASVALGCGAFFALGVAPLFVGLTPPIPLGYAMLFFLLIYVGAALAVARFRLFELDAWAFQILYLLAGGVLLLGLDALLMAVVGLTAGSSFAVALLALATLYLPLRDLVWRRLSRRRRRDRDRLFEMVAEAAFARGSAAERWRTLLGKLFDPLDIVALAETPETPAIGGEGIALDLPPVAGVGAVSVRYPWGGRGLFGPADLRMVDHIIQLLGVIERQRGDYERGVQAERLRVARDLHDDVGARLLSALHTADEATRPALHDALGDIRAIISDLEGETRSLDRVVAELRYEAARRLDALDIQLDWPLDDAAAAVVIIDYATYKALTSAIREAMSNLMRHAKPRVVSVRIACRDDRLEATVTNDGAPASAFKSRGHGLRNIASRVEGVGGGFDIRREEERVVAELWLPVAMAERVAL